MLNINKTAITTKANWWVLEIVVIISALMMILNHVCWHQSNACYVYDVTAGCFLVAIFVAAFCCTVWFWSWTRNLDSWNPTRTTGIRIQVLKVIWTANFFSFPGSLCDLNRDVIHNFSSVQNAYVKTACFTEKCWALAKIMCVYVRFWWFVFNFPFFHCVEMLE